MLPLAFGSLRTPAGNVYQRNKAISAFQGGDASDQAGKPRVLMLSLVHGPATNSLGEAHDPDVFVGWRPQENAASGTNLTGATHILLVDPISGSPKRARAIEAQVLLPSSMTSFGRARRDAQWTTD